MVDISEMQIGGETSAAGKLWLNVLYQALSDLEKPTRWDHVTDKVRHEMKTNPYRNDLWRSAMGLIFSGRDDDHLVFQGTGVNPASLRQQVLSLMKDGQKVQGPQDRCLPFYGVDYRKARINLMRGYEWAAKKFKQPMAELYAPDCHKQIQALLAL
jgi:hypothetical protein